MKNRWWYNILFMLIITVFFSGILVSINVFTRPLITANEQLNAKKAYLNAFQIDIKENDADENIDTLYKQYIRQESDYFKLVDRDGKAAAYGFPFIGGGLWGEIQGVVALSVDLDTVIGIDFISQNETPGLGGRIEEAWFKEQFQGIQLERKYNPIQYNTSNQEGQVDAITGATVSSNAVVNILNNKINDVKKQLGGKQ